MARVPRTRTNIRIGGRPFPNPTSEREELMNDLYMLKVLVPEAAIMPIDQLRGIVAWQTEKAATEELARTASAAPYGTSLPEDEIRASLKDIQRYRRAKQENRKNLY